MQRSTANFLQMELSTRTDTLAESTSTKLEIYLADSTPAQWHYLSTDQFTEHATLDTVTPKYAGAITTANKDLKVL